MVKALLGKLSKYLEGPGRRRQRSVVGSSYWVAWDTISVQ